MSLDRKDVRLLAPWRQHVEPHAVTRPGLEGRGGRHRRNGAGLIPERGCAVIQTDYSSDARGVGHAMGTNGGVLVLKEENRVAIRILTRHAHIGPPGSAPVEVFAGER